MEVSTPSSGAYSVSSGALAQKRSVAAKNPVDVQLGFRAGAERGDVAVLKRGLERRLTCSPAFLGVRACRCKSL